MPSPPFRLGGALRQHYEKAVFALALIALAGVGLFMANKKERTNQAVHRMTLHVVPMRTNAAPYTRTNMAPCWSTLERSTNFVRLDLGKL